MTGLGDHTQRPLNDTGIYERPAQDAFSSSSRSLVIVSNVRAALEYEERTRQGTWGSGYSSPPPTPGQGGLPPPPRPRSRVRPPHAPPVGELRSVSVPTSPLTSTQQLGTSEPVASNPYINPVPRLSYLLRDESQLAVFNGPQASQDSFSTGHGSSNDSHTNASARPRDDARGTPAEQFPESPVSPRVEGVRHQRGLSSLARVEKMLGRSKTALGIKFSDVGLRSTRRSSDADLQHAGIAEKPTKDALMRQYRRVLEKGKLGAEPPSSAPSSPISSAGSVDGSRTSPLNSSTRIGAGPSTRPAAVAAVSLALSPTLPRPVLSHARQSSDMSATSLSPSDASTHDPPSTIAERRISISSTIYPSRQHSFDFPYNTLGRSATMNDDDRESFIDLTSPTFSPQSYHFPQVISTHYGVALDSRISPQSYTSEDSNNQHMSSTKPLLPRLATTSTKPPLPTTPKPTFRRSRSAQPPPDRSASHGGKESKEASSIDSFAADMDRGLCNMPSTTNLLDPRERAERVRKTRKLAQLFGQTPGVVPEPLDTDLANGCLPPVTGGLGIAPSFMKRKHKQAASMLDDSVVPVYDAQKRVVWPSPEDAQHIYLGARRRSVPFTPQDLSSIGGLSYSEDSHSILTISRDASHVIEIGSQEGAQDSDWDSHIGHRQHEAQPSGSPTSFIDLSDEEGPHDGLSELRSADTPKFQRRPGQPFSPSTPSLLENLSPEQQAEEERRRKREKLAKLHRFLGSRVPPHLVLGSVEEGVPLPPPAPSTPMDTTPDDEGHTRKMRARRRRSSSAAEFSGTWSDDIDRLKEDLNDREKAINVRRAVKMEKMFGVAPPQMLYHTRQVMSSPGSTVAPVGSKPWQPSPHSPQSPTSLSAFRNLNQSAYKGKSKKGGRPGTAESTEPLLDQNEVDQEWEPTLPAPMSDVYLHYRHSLNSLNHIIDRDDKQSLAELHDYLSSNKQDSPGGGTSPADEAVAPSTPSLSSSKAERRRSLPTRTSMTSVSSEWSLLPSPPEDATFQTRRRRAAKLTQFFGVNYRDLMSEILESIEKGLEEERGKGTLKPDEVQDLLQKLVRLKTKRNNLS